VYLNPISNVDRAAMETDEKTAVEATDTSWRRRFPQLFGKEYRPPRVSGAYLGTDGSRQRPAADRLLQRRRPRRSTCLHRLKACMDERNSDQPRTTS